MSLILTNQPILRELPRNNPAPAINPRLQETLTRIGGTVPAGGGEYAGMPVYRLAHGQTEKWFSRGKMRIRFPDENIDLQIVQERFFVAPEVFVRAAAWQRARLERRRERFLNADFTVFAETEPLSGYLRQFESSLDYMQLADERGNLDEIEMGVESIAATDAPADWLYLCDVREIIEIGKNCWYAMRWIPASSHGGRKSWNELRYTQNAFIPELDAEVPLIDDLGEFPESGFWIPRFEIAEYLMDERGRFDANNYHYLEPCEENCIEPVREEIYERACLTNQQKNPEWRARQQAEHLRDKRAKLLAATKSRIYEQFEIDQIAIQ